MGKKKVIDRKGPEWLLNEGWGIGRDSHNWILMHKAKKENKEWTKIGYWHSPDQLLRAYHERYGMMTEGEKSLLAHITRVGQDVVQAIDRVCREIKRQDIKPERQGYIDDDM